MRIKLIFISVLLASCSGHSIPLISPYKMDIHQGNLLTPAMRESIKLGMSKQQVRYALGTPLVNDAYHDNRWDYVYRLEHGGKIVDKQRLTLYFAGDNLAGIDDGSTVVGNISALASSESKGAQEMTKPLVPAIFELAAKPAETSVPVAAQSKVGTESLTNVQKTLYAWAESWSDKDVGRYLAFYAAGFKADGMNRAEWEGLRTARIKQPKVIKVGLEDIKVDVLDANHATATFTQTYRSDRYHDVTRKIMPMEKIGDIWLIVSEQVAK